MKIISIEDYEDYKGDWKNCDYLFLNGSRDIEDSIRILDCEEEKEVIVESDDYDVVSLLESFYFSEDVEKQGFLRLDISLKEYLKGNFKVEDYIQNKPQIAYFDGYEYCMWQYSGIKRREI